MKKLLLLSFILLLSFPLLFAQNDWGQMMTDPNANLFEIEQSVQDWIAQHPNKKPPKPMLRWIERMRVYADENGYIDRTQEVRAAQEAVRLRQQSSRAGNWSHLGPKTPIKSSGGGSRMDGIGRVNSITFHPTQPATIFAGTPGGGLFKSTDYGLNWLPLTDGLPSLGVSDLVINSQNPDIMYMATGDSDGGDTPCLGILKTTDGGQNWTNVFSNTAVFPSNRNGFYVDEMIIHPSNPDTLLLATSRGIYRTADGGQNWTLAQMGNFEDIEFHPTNPNIVYAVGYGGNDGFVKSIDNGQNWTIGAMGLPAAGTNANLGRMMVAVSEDEPDYVYVLITKNGSGDFEFHGLYRSTDSAQSFTARNTSAGTFEFGQAFYDLTLNVSPLDADLVYMADVPFHRSNDGGTTWTRLAGYRMGNIALHVDFHTIEFSPFTKDLWVGSDGGVHVALNQNPGNTFETRSNGLHASQFYRLGTSVQEDGYLLAGAQDNGTIQMRNNTWESADGADGMECLISWEEPEFFVTSWQSGTLRRHSFGNTSGWITQNSTGESGAWTTPIIQDPNNPRTYYAGFENVWITQNQASWTNLTGTSGVFGGSTLHKILVPQKSQGFFIYAMTRGTFYQSLDKGASWKSFNMPGTFQDLAANYNNPRTLYGAFNNGVWTSADAGETWTNMSDGLPAGLPAMAIVYQKGGQDALYAGTSVGIYYRDSSMTSWVPFMDGLPNVEIGELEISYCAGKIRAATYGRGVWESDLYNNGYQKLSNEMILEYPPAGGIRLEAKPSGGLGPYTYLWHTGNFMQVLNNPTPGTYSVTITDKNHCTTKDTIVVNATAIDNQFEDVTELEVFPNPATDVIQLRFQTAKSDIMKVGLINSMGQQISTTQLELRPGRNQFSISLSDLSSGIYFLRMEMDNETTQTKIIKQ